MGYNKLIAKRNSQVLAEVWRSLLVMGTYRRGKYVALPVIVRRTGEARSFSAMGTLRHLLV